jgi:hypothetical protein
LHKPDRRVGAASVFKLAAAGGRVAVLSALNTLLAAGADRRGVRRVVD